MEATRVLPIRKVEQAENTEPGDSRPTETRYGWCPFADINLMGPDGTTTLYVQPTDIADGQRVIANPLHRTLPKGQLIPFPTFNATIWTLSEELRDSRGLAMPVQSNQSKTALESIVAVLRVYSGWGFTILSSLQGLDQDMAGRIFQVVQPLNYLIKDLPSEMELGAFERIEAMNDIVFDLEDGQYTVPRLTTDYERAIARNLANEMAAGASIAFDFATTIFDDTVVSINTRLAGGQGKTGPDPLDRYLIDQLGRGRDIPSANRDASPTAGLEAKLDYLVETERQRTAQEEIERLKAEIAALKAPVTESVEVAAQAEVCGAEKTTGGTCKMVLKDGQCPYHPREVV